MILRKRILNEKTLWLIFLLILIYFIDKILNGFLIFLLFILIRFVFDNKGDSFLYYNMIVSKMKKVSSVDNIRNYVTVHANQKTNDYTSATNHYRHKSVYVCNKTNDLLITDCPMTSKAVSKGNINSFIGESVFDKIYLAKYNLKVTRLSNNQERNLYIANLLENNNARARPKQKIDFELVDEVLYNCLKENYEVDYKPLIDSNADFNTYIKTIQDYNLAKELIEIVQQKID